MTRTTLPLSLALVVSIALNVMLLRREPPTAPPRPAPGPVERPVAATVEVDADKILLREEVRILREKLAVAKTKLELKRDVFGLPVDTSGDQPETRDFQQLMNRLQDFFESREVEGREESGRLVKVIKAVLPPSNRDAALREIEDYLGLGASERLSFHAMAESALGAYHRIAEEYTQELFAAAKAGENDEFFEDNARRRQEVADRMARRQDDWMRDHVQPLRKFLERRDGIRPSLLSDHLSSALMQLGTPDER
jgi:hypothetical protein